MPSESLSPHAAAPPTLQRRVWTAEEKLSALDYYHTTGSKKRTARELNIPCTKMLRDWLSIEAILRDATVTGGGAARRISRKPLPFDGVTGKSAVSAFLAHGLAVGGVGEGECVDAGEGGGKAGSAAFGGFFGVGERGDAVPASQVDVLVGGWLAEDCPGFDYGGAVVGSREVTAVLYAKSGGMLAGCLFFDAVFRRVGCEVLWGDGYRDGSVLKISDGGKLAVATVRGPAKAVLQGERVGLNALAECSGVASASARVVEIAKRVCWGGRLAGTRKTTPGFRLVQKYGMMVGGMDTHRIDLSGMIMLKDNHIAAAGGIAGAVAHAKLIGGFSLKVDVECGDEEEAMVAAGAGADVVMLDNFGPVEFERVAKVVKARYPSVIIEGSGGLEEATVEDYMCKDADVLSFSINRYATALDMSLKIREDRCLDR